MRKFVILRLIVSFLTVISLSAVIIYFIFSSKELFFNHSYFSLKTIVKEKSESIETEINYAESSIKLLSDFVSSQMKERELKNPNEIFSRYSEQLPFDLIEYIRWDGLNLMNSIKNEKPFDASERPYYIEGIKGNSGIWPNFKPKVSKEVLLNFYTPLYYNGEISGVITGAIGEMTSLKPKLISSYFGHQIQSFVCDSDYIVVSSACENIYPGLDLKKWKSYKILADFMEHSSRGDTEPFLYEYEGRKGLCCTSEIGKNGWRVVVIVYPSVLKAVKKETSGNLFIISALIFVIMVLYLAASLFIQARISKIVQDKLLNLAIKDELTGLYNRHAYESDLKTIAAESLHDDFNYVVFDVNGLKNVNDSLGHEAGDELIKAAASCINQCFSGYGKVYRTGGDEFIAIVTASEEEIANIKEKFAKTTGAWKGKYTDHLVIPAGYVSKKEMPDVSVIDMAKHADHRMYKKKTLTYIASGVDRRAKNDAYEVLCKSYTKILKINLKNDDFSIIQLDSVERDSEKGYSEKISEWLKGFGMSEQVHKDDVEDFLKQTSLEYMRDYFNSGKKEMCVQYRRLIGNDFHKVMMEIKAANDYSQDNQICFLYVKNIEK